MIHVGCRWIRAVSAFCWLAIGIWWLHVAIKLINLPSNSSAYDLFDSYNEIEMSNSVYIPTNHFLWLCVAVVVYGYAYCVFGWRFQWRHLANYSESNQNENNTKREWVRERKSERQSDSDFVCNNCVVSLSVKHFVTFSFSHPIQCHLLVYLNHHLVSFEHLRPNRCHTVNCANERTSMWMFVCAIELVTGKRRTLLPSNPVWCTSLTLKPMQI